MVVQWSNQTSFPDGLPSVPVFDRTLPVKQIHVLEALDILVLRADKGAALRWWLWEEMRAGVTCSRPQVLFPAASAVVLWWPTSRGSGGTESIILPDYVE